MLFPKLFGAGFTLAALITSLSLSTGLPVRAQAPLNVDGIADRTTYDLRVWFRVPTTAGYSYQVLLDGQPVPTDLTNWVDSVDYHEVLVTRTNSVSADVTNRLVRFIVQSDRGNPEKGLIKWTPYPPIPSTAAETAGARLRVITPQVYPQGLPIPVVVWVDDEQDRAHRVNAFVTAAGFEASPVQIFRGAGSGMLPAATVSGPLTYGATLPGLQTNKVINVENTTTWTARSGVLATSEVWPANSRIHLTAGLTVPAGLTLTIGAGTIVKLNPLVNLTNNGQVTINGTVDQPVVFTATNIVFPERTAGAWGGFVMRGTPSSRPVLEVNGAIFTGGAGGTGWSFPDPSTSHKSQQPVILMSNAVTRLTNSAIISSAGQVHNGYNPELTYDHTLCQRAITCGECVGGTVTINHSAIIEFPNDDGVVDGTIADADYDGMYFTTGTHILRDSLFGFAKDDALDSGSGDAGTMWVTNCWVESAQHEAHAWSGSGRRAQSYDIVLMNSGQGLECGWSSSDGSPDVFAERMLSTGNSIGVRFGDNYDWDYWGPVKVTNSLILHNYRDVWGMNWDNWLYGIKTPTGPFMMDIRSNYVSQANTNHPGNALWDPARDGWRLAHWMTTPPDAPVGVGLAVRTNQFVLTNLFAGVPVRLSSFTTNPVTVNYAFESGGSPLAAGSLTFAPGETLKRIYPAGFDVSAQGAVQLVLGSAVGGELTGRTNASFTGSLPAPRVGCWVSTNTLPMGRLAEGLLVKLSTPSGLPVSVDYVYAADGVTLAGGTLTFAPGTTVQRISPPAVNPAAYDAIQLNLSQAVGAALSGITGVLYGNPPVQVSLAVGVSQLDLTAFTSGVPVALNREAVTDVFVDFQCEGLGGVLTNGTVTLAAGQTVHLLALPTVNPAQHDLLRVSLSNARQAQLVAPSEVYYVRMAPAQSPLLVVAGSIWKYLDTGVDAGTAWRLLGYNDSAWQSGCAQLGYGDSDECTVVSYGPSSSSKYITTYFRQKFVASDPGVFTNLAMWLLRDDGGVVYLNGTEVYRSPSMPAAPAVITYQTLANAQGSSAPPDNTVDQANVASARLVAGTNIVAVEIHQHRGDSSDLSFDFSLTGQPPPPPPPQHLYWGTFSDQGVLVWGDPTFALQLSDKVTGPWTNVVGALSPFTVMPGPGNAFYRLRR